jgi:hypothetical protein
MMAKQKSTKIETSDNEPTHQTKNELTTTLGALVNAEGALGRLAAQAVSVKTAYHFLKLIKVVQEETTHYHTQRDTLIKEMGAERKVTPAEIAQGMTGMVFEVKPKNIKTYAARMKELIELPVTLTTQWLLTRTVLDASGRDIYGRSTDLHISAADIMALDTLVVDDD